MTFLINWKDSPQFWEIFFISEKPIFLGLKMPLLVHRGREQTTVGYCTVVWVRLGLCLNSIGPSIYDVGIF
jgi:hypothetical protein